MPEIGVLAEQQTVHSAAGQAQKQTYRLVYLLAGSEAVSVSCPLGSRLGRSLGVLSIRQQVVDLVGLRAEGLDLAARWSRRGSGRRGSGCGSGRRGPRDMAAKGI